MVHNYGAKFKIGQLQLVRASCCFSAWQTVEGEWAYTEMAREDGKERNQGS